MEAVQITATTRRKPTIEAVETSHDDAENTLTDNKNTTETSRALSRRELDILNLVARGFRYAEIAKLEFISINTVQSHVRNIHQKLKVNSKSEAVFEAVQQRLIKLSY